VHHIKKKKDNKVEKYFDHNKAFFEPIVIFFITSPVFQPFHHFSEKDLKKRQTAEFQS